MQEFIQHSLAGFAPFALYFVASVLLLGAFTFIYIRITPYQEIGLIRRGNAAAAASLSGAMIGYVLPLAHSVAQSANIVDMLIWGVIALVVQLAAYVVVRMLIPGIVRDIPEGHVAQGVFLGAVSIATGILNAACMTY